MNRRKVINYSIFKLILVSILVALCCSVLAFSLKHLTEFFQEKLFHTVGEINTLLYIFLPTIGITAIYFLRKYFFKKRKNKGLTEIFNTLDQRKDHMKFFKIPSHFINGFLTLVFGGSTGIEVATVVATGTVGNQAYKSEFSANTYKRELICAGVAAGVSVLFGNPLVGWLFAIEVVAKKTRKTLLISTTVASLASWLFIYFFDNSSFFHYELTGWNWYAIPYIIVLSVLAGLVAVYFTFIATRIKKIFGAITNNFIQVNAGAIAVGLLLFLFPFLYGDSYGSMKEFVASSFNSENISILLLFALILLKPLAASLTLGAGGDGGVFGPSIVTGALLGLFVAHFCNQFWNTELITINFVLIGIAATLSATIYAPFTALILACSLTPNGYVLFFPLLIGCFVSLYISKKLLPYNVYTYDFYVASKKS